MTPTDDAELAKLITIKFGQMMIRAETYPNVGELVDTLMPLIIADRQQTAKAVIARVREELPGGRDVLDERNLTLVNGRPPHWVDWNYGYNEGVVDVRAALDKIERELK